VLFNGEQWFNSAFYSLSLLAVAAPERVVDPDCGRMDKFDDQATRKDSQSANSLSLGELVLISLTLRE
jgi:hypothetical protein